MFGFFFVFKFLYICESDETKEIFLTIAQRQRAKSHQNCLLRRFCVVFGKLSLTERVTMLKNVRNDTTYGVYVVRLSLTGIYRTTEQKFAVL